MRLTTWSSALAAALLALPLLAQEPAPTPSAPPAAAAPAVSPTPVPKPYEDIIKLWHANLSEDFIKRQIENGSIVYDLSADEVIRCRDAGIPESLIQVMLSTKTRRVGEPEKPVAAAAGVATPAPVAPVSPATPVAPAATPAPAAPSFAADADRTWEAMVRRNSGIVLKSRWDVGTLRFKAETLHWEDAKDSGKNLLIPARQIKEQFLTCLKKAGGNECFEWGFRTKGDDYRFRDVAWTQGENRKVQEIFDFFKAIYPSLVSSTIPVDSK